MKGIHALGIAVAVVIGYLLYKHYSTPGGLGSVNAAYLDNSAYGPSAPYPVAQDVIVGQGPTLRQVPLASSSWWNNLLSRLTMPVSVLFHTSPGYSVPPSNLSTRYM